MNMESIVLAGGCFWGLQAFLRRLPGVNETEVGYANSKVPNPSYQQVCSQMTGSTEAVEVRFDPSIISLRQLLDAFFEVIDPTVANRQGNDIGTNYRTGIYYTSELQIPVIKQTMRTEQKQYGRPLVTEILPLKNFYPAEEYHQDYLEINPGGYCHIPVSVINSFQLKSREELAREDAA